MGIHWNLREYLAREHGIYRATELRKKVAKETGILISVAQLCKLVNQRPKMIRFETAEILVSALQCKLEDFFKVTPKKMNPEHKRKLSYKNTPRSKIGIKAFPSPADYKA